VLACHFGCVWVCVCVLQGWEFNEKTHLLKYRFKKIVGECDAATRARVTRHCHTLLCCTRHFSLQPLGSMSRPAQASYAAPVPGRYLKPVQPQNAALAKHQGRSPSSLHDKAPPYHSTLGNLCPSSHACTSDLMCTYLLQVVLTSPCAPASRCQSHMGLHCVQRLAL
jgi:hypothetical protein